MTHDIGKSRLRFGLNIFMFVAVGVLVLGGWSLYRNFNQVIAQEKWLRHTKDVQSSLDLLLSAMKDAETGARGYLLTNRESYLAPYQQGRLEVWGHYQRTRNLTRDNESQQAQLDVLERTLTARLAILADILRPENVRKAGSLDLSEGQSVMIELRKQVDLLKEAEEQLLQQRTEQTERGHLIFQVVLLGTIVLSIGFIFFAFAQSRRNQWLQANEAEARSLESLRKTRVAEVATLVTGDGASGLAARKVSEYLASTFDLPALNFYLLHDGELQLSASYASALVNGASPSSARLSVGQTLLGEAFLKKDISVVRDIPEHYFSIASSLGQTKPSLLTFVPIPFQGRNIGVIEIAMFKALSEESLATLREIAMAAGIGLNALRSREQLQKLLETTQQQSEELQAQQEELRTNNEELEEQARTLENQQLALNLRNRELESARLEVEQKAVDLEKTSRYKSDFLAKMSHELRTPLNSLLILATLLIENRDNNLTDKQKEFARSIQDAGNDLLNLINDILDLSKIEAQKLSLRPERFKLSQVLHQIESTFQPQFQSKGLILKTTFENGLKDFEILTDRQRLEQILRNLLSNAFKFTEKGEVLLQLKNASDPNRLLISVQDSGIGIATDKRDLIFEAFEQADGSISRKYGGTGLGLTISRELAGLLGGFIRVESDEGKGSEFILNIPKVMQNNRDMRETPSASYDQTRAAQPETRGPEASRDESLTQAKAALAHMELGHKSILIVEDDPTFRKSVAEAAQSFGFQPIEAADGEIALAILERHLPSAVLLDIKLPGISGLGLLEMIKQSPQLRHLPIHMISAMEHQQNAMRLGAMGYLAKPVTIDKVKLALTRIEKLLSKKVKNLLIIEDDPRQSEAIRHLIEGSDIEIATAASGNETLELVNKVIFDCIIMDLNLPDISGPDLLDRLTAMNLSLPPIVIYTGKDLSREETDRLRKYSESIILKGAKSPERLLDEVNLFLHRVEAMLPEEQKEMLLHLRSRDQLFDGKTVLVVDDDMRNVFALTNALEGKGFKVQIARDGQEAIDWLAKNPVVDIVLMDIMMPRMDGLEAMRRIRQMPVFKNIPIIALTAKAMKEDHERCIEAGANDYLPKPINLTNLTSVLKVWLSTRGFMET